ncbi:MAG: hypothetical protein PHS53_00910 [Candidatus Pacebacteria bacterium]|nr:hypothetical protein [Candidatus Paceibacterota bacterium]MDD5356697.1 hypothetical protein [Candidatus Paceibacterota bacterium]
MILKQKQGFIALISTIVISVVLLLVVSTASLTGFYGRSDILDSELKERTNALAEACVDKAILYVADGSAHTYPELVSVSTDKCYIDSISAGVIKTHALYSSFRTNLQVTINTANFSVFSWEEVP